jgi:hypothetical protein
MPSPSPLSKEPTGEMDLSSMGAAKKEETPLTIAMRQAGAEAAKKASEKKGSKPPTSVAARSLGGIEVPMPAIETKMARTVEEPDVSAETTAAKVPEKLAQEGAKRTSLDKISEEGAKRTSMEKADESDGTSEHEHGGLSKEATVLEARRASSLTKMKSPLSEESAVSSSTEFVGAHFEPRARTHRGSSVSAASKEEIEEIEKRYAIPEEDEEEKNEEDEDSDESSTRDEAKGTDIKSASMPHTEEDVPIASDASTTDVTVINEGEFDVMKGLRPQEQDAKDPQGASASVGD